MHNAVLGDVFHQIWWVHAHANRDLGRSPARPNPSDDCYRTMAYGKRQQTLSHAHGSSQTPPKPTILVDYGGMEHDLIMHPSRDCGTAGQGSSASSTARARGRIEA